MCTNKKASANSRSCTRAARFFSIISYFVDKDNNLHRYKKRPWFPIQSAKVFLLNQLYHTPDSYKGSTSVSKTEN